MTFNWQSAVNLGLGVAGVVEPDVRNGMRQFNRGQRDVERFTGHFRNAEERIAVLDGREDIAANNVGTAVIKSRGRNEAAAREYDSRYAPPESPGMAGSSGDSRPATDRNGRPVQNQGQQNPGQQLVDAITAANNGSPGALQESVRLAAQFKNESTGKFEMPPGRYSADRRRNAFIFNETSTYDSPEAAVTAISRVLDGMGIGEAKTAVAAPTTTTPATSVAPTTTTAPVTTTPAAPTTGTTTAPTTQPSAADQARLDEEQRRAATTGAAGQQPATRSAPASGTTTPTAGSATQAAGAAASASAAEKDMKQDLQLQLERLGLTTGTKNTDTFQRAAAGSDSSEQMDGIVGPKTQASIKTLQKALGLPETGVASAELLARIDTPAELEAVRSSLPGASAPSRATAAPAPVVAAPPAVTSNAPAADEAQMAAAVAAFASLANGDKNISAADIAAVTPESARAMAPKMDLNRDGKVDETEIGRITTAAVQRLNITVSGGAAALNPLFASAFTAPAAVPTQGVEARTMEFVPGRDNGTVRTMEFVPGRDEGTASNLLAARGTDAGKRETPSDSPPLEVTPPRVPDARTPQQRQAQAGNTPS